MGQKPLSDVVYRYPPGETFAYRFTREQCGGFSGPGHGGDDLDHCRWAPENRLIRMSRTGVQYAASLYVA
jgi:hypothetical protein